MTTPTESVSLSIIEAWAEADYGTDQVDHAGYSAADDACKVHGWDLETVLYDLGYGLPGCGYSRV